MVKNFPTHTQYINNKSQEEPEKLEKYIYSKPENWKNTLL